MAVGYAADKAALDSRAGHLAASMRDLLVDVQRMKMWLDARTDEQVMALGYTADEVTLLKSAFTQLDALRAIATGQSTQATANNFLHFSNQLVGVN